MKNVAIFFGGDSNEREISLITGLYAVNLLKTVKELCVYPVWILPSGEMKLASKAAGIEDFKDEKKFSFVSFARGGLAVKRKKIILDCALNCCHGGAGEDGTLGALLEWHQIPSASPDLFASSVFMQKRLGKIAAKGLGIPVVDGFCAREGEWLSDRDRVRARTDEFGYPLVVKPNRLGSSIGISVVKDGAEFAKALDLCFRLDDDAVIERYLEGKRDLNCAACRRKGEILLSPVEEVRCEGELLSFSEKYERSERKSFVPAPISGEEEAAVRRYLKRIYEEFDITGVVRCDFLLADKVYFNELNVVPGSLATYLFGQSLSEAKAFLLSLVEEAKKPQKKARVTTGILDCNAFQGAKACKRRGNRV